MMLERLSFPNPLRYMHWPLLVVGTLGLGILLGQGMLTPSQDNIVPLVVMLFFVLLLVANPKLGLLTWLVAYPFIGETVNLSLGAGLPDLSLTRFCVGFLTLMLMMQITTGRRPMFKITRVDVAALIFFLAIGISNLAADDPVWAFQFTTDSYFVPLLVYFIARNLIESRQDVRWVISALLVIGFYSALYLFYEHTTGNVLFYYGDPRKLATDYGYGVRIVRGLLGGPHVFGLVFTMAMPFAVQRYLEAKSSGRRVLYLALSGLLLVGIFFSYKRGIWLAAVISLLVIQFLHPRFRRFFLVFLVLVCLGLVFVGDQLTDSAAAQRLNDDLETGNGRTLIWEEAIRLWEKSPILGYGFGRFSKLTAYEVTENFYLNILVSAGLVGLVPFLVLILFVARDSATLYVASRQATHSRLFVNWEIIAVFTGAAVSYLAKAFSGNMAAPLPNIILFLLVGAIVEAQASRLTRNKLVTR